MDIKLLKKKKETDDIYSFLFKPPKPVSWKAGQFIYFVLPHDDVDDRGDERYFTISTAPFEENIMLTTRFDFKNGSSFKKALFNLKEGETVDTYNIGGNLTVEDYNRKYVFIAGGIGITPFRSILLDLDHKNKLGNITLLYGNRDENNIAFKKIFEDLERKNQGLRVKHIIGQIDKKIIKDNIIDIKDRTYYVSGPVGMVKAVESTLKELGVSKEKILKDYFPGYKE